MYLLIFGTSAVLLFCAGQTKDKILRKILIVISLLIPSVLAGLRDYSIGNDVLLYGNGWFERACSYDSLLGFLKKAHEYNIGVGYATINWVVSRFTSTPHWFYFFYELLQLIVLYFAIKPFEGKINLPYAFLIYYFCYYNSSLNLLRQIMAVVLVLFSYRYVVSKKIIKFIFVIVLAFSFHSSAVIGLLLYPLSCVIENQQLKYLSKIGIICGSFLLVLSYEYVFNTLVNLGFLSSERYAHYLTDTYVGGRFVRLAYWGILLILVLWRRERCLTQIELYRTLEMYMIISTIMSLITFLGTTWIIRIAYYFDIFQILMLPFLAERLGIKFRNCIKKGGYLVILMVVFSYWLITYVIRNGAATYPYMFMTY